MAELKRDILEYERSTGRKLFELRRLFNSAILEGGAIREDYGSKAFGFATIVQLGDP